MSPLNKPATILIDSRGADMPEPKVGVLSTTGQSIPVSLETIEAGKYKADFLPFQVGKFRVRSYRNLKPILNVIISISRTTYGERYDE